jgi:glucose/arabinose dehydrogenase
MRLRFVIVLLSLTTAGWLFVNLSTRPGLVRAEKEPAVDAPAAPVLPYGIDERTPWTNSKIVGTPNPPPPYRVKRAFPKVTFRQPLAVSREPGTDNLLVIEHYGGYEGPAKILRIKDDPAVEKAEPFLDMNRIAYGVAYHPDFLKNGYIYIGSNGPDGSRNKKDRISRFTVSREAPYACDPKSELVILEWESDGHNGADLAFGPDGYLYISSGDGTSDSDLNLRGQDLSKLTSKVLRIDIDHADGDKPYSVPKDNPFVGREGTCPETWCYGMRNPWRLTYDHKSNQLWVGQNGQDQWEQAYLIQKGANYGWSVQEGSHPFQLARKRGPEPITPPTVEHPHSESRSLTGGVVYHGNKYSDLEGAYIYGDYSTGKIWGVRHDGTRTLWHKELANTRLQITGFGLDTHGEVLVVDHAGGLYEFEPRGEAPKGKFPTRLSDTGLFTSVKGYQTDPGLVPYSVNASLWSDGAVKERHIALPGSAQIDFTSWRGWNFPDNSVLVKTFSLPIDPANPTAMNRIETRLMVKTDGEWLGYSYLWNAEQTDAELVANEGADKVYVVCDSNSPGGMRKQTWHYPSRVECMVCHSRAANYVLGLTEIQMNKVHNYGKVADNQLRTLEHIGLFRVNKLEHVAEWKRKRDAVAQWPVNLAWSFFARPAPSVNWIWSMVPDPLAPLEKELRDHAEFTTQLPKRPDEYRQLPDPTDAKQPLNARARAYLHANCAHCHVEAGGGNSALDVEFTTAPDRMRIFDVKPQHDAFGITDARIIAPGTPDRSVLLQRLNRRGTGQMPPLASTMVDQKALELLREWITTYHPEPPHMPAN